MKILYIANVIPWPVDNGKKLRIMSFLKSLGNDHEIDYMCLNSENKNKKTYEGLKKIVHNLRVLGGTNDLPRSNITQRLRHLFSTLPYSVLRYRSADMRHEIEKAFQQTTYDCLICDGLHIAVNIPHGINTVKIINEHNIEYLILERYAQQERNIFTKIYALLESRKLKDYEKSAWDDFDHIIVCSDIDKKIVQTESNNQNVITIPNTINIIKYSYPARKIKFNLAFMGGLDWIPNHDGVLYFFNEIYPLIKKVIPKVTFAIIGRNPTKQIRAIATQDTSVTVTGTVEDIKPFLAQSQVVIVPLRMGSGTRLKILEAMAMKKPVVSTTIGAEGIDCTDEDNILLADDEQDFAQKVIKLLQDDSLRNRLASKGHELVLRNYDIDVVRRIFSSAF